MSRFTVPWDRLKRLVRAARLNEAAVLGVILLIVLGVWGFAELADEVVERETRAFDEWVLQAMRGGDVSEPFGPPWLFETMRDITALGSYVVLGLAVLVVVLALLMLRKPRAAVLLLIASVLGTVLSNGLKAIFGRPRPEVVEHAVRVTSESFPSGHAMLSAVIYLTLAVLLVPQLPRRRLKVLVIGTALFLTFIVGISRMYLGVHYPTDVLAGWAAGLSWALLCWLGERYLERRGAVEHEAEPVRRTAEA